MGDVATPEPETQDLRAAAITGLRWTAIARPAGEVLMLGSMVVLAHLIPPAEFGRFAVTIIVTELAIMLSSEGVGTALVQRKTVTREHLQAGFALALLIGAAVAAVGLVAASVVVAPIFGDRTAELVRLTTPALLLSGAATVPYATLRRRLAFRRMSVIDIAATSTRALACVGFALSGFDAEALILGSLVAGFVTVAMVWVSAPAPPPRLRRGPARDLLSYGLPAAFASLSWVGFRNCDYAIVGARLGAVQAGLYFRAYTLAVEYQKKVSAVMQQVGFPLLARSRDPAEMASLRAQMVRLLTIGLFPLLALLAVVAPVLVPWLFGPAWAPAVVPTQILVIGGASTIVIDAAGAVLMAAGRPRALLGYGFAHFGAYALAVLVMAPHGLVAVAAAAAAVHAVFLVVAYALMLHGSPGHPLRTLWSDIAPATVSCLGLVAAAVPANAALSAARLPAFPQLCAVALAGVVGYMLALRVGFPAAWRRTWAVVRDVLPTHRLRRSKWGLAPAEGTSGT